MCAARRSQSVEYTMIELSLPGHVRRVQLRSYWLALTLVIGPVVVLLGFLLGSVRGALFAAGMSAACALAGVLRPRLVRRPYRAWNSLAIRVSRSAELWSAAVGFSLLPEWLRRAGGGSPGGARWREGSGWSPRAGPFGADGQTPSGPGAEASARNRQFSSSARSGARPGRLWEWSLMPLLVMEIPFRLVALLTRFFQGVLERPGVDWKEVVEYEPTIGWMPRANLDVRAMADEPFRMRTGADGWRGSVAIEESDIVVFGSTFASGYGVNDEEMYAALAPGLRIKSVGVNGYSLVQSLLWMERYRQRLAGKMVVWLIYHGTDLDGALCPHLDYLRRPFLRECRGEAGWEIVGSHVTPARWPYASKRSRLNRLAEICGDGFVSNRVLSASTFLIGRAAGVCRDAGATLIVVTAPDLTQVSPAAIERLRAFSAAPDRLDPALPDRRLAESCRRFAVPFVALRDHLRAVDFRAGGMHWAPSGHRRVAEVLAQLHAEYLSGEGPEAETDIEEAPRRIEIERVFPAATTTHAARVDAPDSSPRMDPLRV